MRAGLSTVCGGILLVGSFTLGGCYESLEAEATAPERHPDAGPRGESGPVSSYGHGSSALGGARRAAEGTAEGLQQRSQEIADGDY